MVRHQGRVIWRGHLGGKKSRLGSVGEGPGQGENEQLLFKGHKISVQDNETVLETLMIVVQYCECT